MEENKAFQMSKSICKIYRKLATLEKEEKKDTPKWKEMFSMLVLSKKYEEEDYTNSPRESELEERKLNLKEGQFTDFIFEITPEVLTSMRILNKSRIPAYSLLYPYSMEEDFYEMMNMVQEQSYVLIENALQNKKLSPEERNQLIDYKYALLMTTPSLEYFFTSKEKVPFVTNATLKEEEREKATKIFFYDIQIETDRISLLRDEEVSSMFILELLVLKAKLGLLDPLYFGMICEELESCLSLIQTFGIMERKKVNRVIEYIRNYLLDFGDVKQK